MKRIQLVSLITALLIAGPALADGGHGHGHGPKHKGHGDHDRVEMYRGDRAPQWRPEPPRHDNGLHLGQRKHWARGQRIPVVYLAPRYYVREYRTSNLAPPPPGMVWVRPYQEDNNFYLVQAATGLISQILGR
jgi:Ni/Co efflux regulator RcnB